MKDVKGRTGSAFSGESKSRKCHQARKLLEEHRPEVSHRKCSKRKYRPDPPPGRKWGLEARQGRPPGGAEGAEMAEAAESGGCGTETVTESGGTEPVWIINGH